MVKKTVTWILVADGAQARLYANDGPGRGIHPATEWDFSLDLPEKVGDMLSDQEGRSANPGGRRAHPLGPRTDPRRHLETEFLRTLASFLEEGAVARTYDRLVLVAPPKALGDLRAKMAPHAAALVTREMDKDLVHLSQNDLEKHLLAADAVL